MSFPHRWRSIRIHDPSLFSNVSCQKHLNSRFTIFFINFHHHCYPKFLSTIKHPNLIQILKSMPKEAKHIAEAQKQRKKIKERISKYVPGKVTLQVLGTGAKGAPRSLYLFSDQSRYLFNCGEGTQRLAHEHKMKLAKLEHIFITQPVWQNLGGLPGTALTIQDVGVPQITLHGPKGLEEIFVATKRFVVIKDLKIDMAECNDKTIYEDNVMSVKYVQILRNEINAKEIQEDVASGTGNRRRRRSNSRNMDDLIEDDTDYYAHELSGTRTTPDSVPLERQKFLQQIKQQGISMAYICKLQSRPGALNLDKCVQMGVPAGPLLGRLKSGESVVLKNGETVTSQQVCEPDDPGPTFIVVDCPTEEYLDSLIENEQFKKHQKYATRDDDVASLVVHFTPKHVLQNDRYKQWVEEFSPSTHHLLLNDCNSCMGSLAVHKIQHKLNLLSKDLFPILGDKGTPVFDITLEHQNKKQRMENKIEQLTVQPAVYDPFIYPNTFFNYHLRPKAGIDRSCELKLTPNDYVAETMNLETFPNVLDDLKLKLQQEKSELEIAEYPKILFLGTGSCIPNKTRNTSGILLSSSDTENILLDCGEGTCGQIVRFFGSQDSDRVLANIKAIYISHLHADHHIGLIGVLMGRSRALKNLGLKEEPVVLFAPRQILVWLNFYDRCFEDICHRFTLIANGDLISSKDTVDHLELFNQLGFLRIVTCYVRHCPNAFGVAIVHKNGYKITYSGDTMPSDNLVEIGEDSDILIHEATMEDELAHEAIIKMHSTTSQAIEIGRRMKAKNVILTHFSQRYAKLPRFNDNFAPNVSIAFDNMTVRLDELTLVPQLFPALRLMFADHYEELEHKAVKRQLRIDREREALQERRKIDFNKV